MRKLLSISIALISAFGALAVCLAQPPQQPVIKAASLDSHEGLTVSAQPWTDASQYKEKFPKKTPLSGGIVAIMVSFRNDSDETVKVALDQVRLNISLSEDNRQELQPLTSEQVADGIQHPQSKDPTATTRFPVPIPRSKGGRDKHWTEIEKEADEAAIPTGVIATHATVQGLLYFDLQGQFDLLNSSHLYIPTIVVMKDNHALTFFDIDLSHPR